eukprot:CAMPEP_0202442484 /NCGR_PEP_ID=MMETSP1360-20130828/1939_1 /ASSEMBLY_ACC=CAM_ASM_000848 /TAXON_ID=515479 /ORGANISM="Licmophora paradoxa, Strain CCMP2313" /LENGTH=198 /DNA_ID=CAMNT_0049057877 /DNA_START=132 /DNA_END=728 /DNA_ORIENTATION=-
MGEIKPINDFVLVKTAGKKEATDEGILLAGSSKIVKTQGTVIAKGSGKVHAETGLVFDIPLEKGDGVVYGEYDGTELDVDGETYMLIRDDNVLLTFKGEKPTMENVEVITDHILVEVQTKESETAGGLLLAASSAENRPSTGQVVKIGPGKMAGDGTLIPMSVAVGDNVKFRNFFGNEVEIEDREFSVVRRADVMAKF